MKAWRRLGLVVLATLGGDAVAAPGTEPPAQAQPTGELSVEEELFRQGVAAYDRQDYRAAMDFFQKAYARSGEPALLFNIAQVHNAVGDCLAAREKLELFIKIARADDPVLPRALARREQLSHCPTKVADASKTNLALDPAVPVPKSSVTAPRSTPAPNAVQLDAAALAPRSWLSSSKLGMACVGGAGFSVAVALAGAGFATAASMRANEVDSATVWDRAAQSAEDQRRAFASAASATFVAAAMSTTAIALTCWLGWRHASRSAR
jgi:hypothetical protein